MMDVSHAGLGKPVGWWKRHPEVPMTHDARRPCALCQEVAPREALRRLDNIIEHVATWEPAGDAFLDDLRYIRAALNR